MTSHDSSMPTLRADGVQLGYAGRVIAQDLTFEVPSHEFTVIIGPNGCGKSTLLRSLGRLLEPKRGAVTLDGADIHRLRTKDVARRVGLLPQSPIAPGAITVADLVAKGRFPHQSLLRQWSPEDEEIVDRALTEVNMRHASDRLVDELSGGQRQRVWIAMALAQDTPVLLLDEPTTYLDIAHQMDVLDLCARLHEAGRTLVAVLHDLNLAARYATHMVAMRDGRIVSQGAPADVLTEDLMREVFELDALVIPDPETDKPMIVPRDRRRTRSGVESAIEQTA